MNIIVNNIKWIMIAAGLITCSMIFATLAPSEALQSMFGKSLTDPLAQMLVRSWGFLIFLTGTLLIYAALNPVHRNLALVFASISKTAFIAIILVFGTQFIGKALVTIAFDSVVVVVFISYLFRVKK